MKTKIILILLFSTFFLNNIFSQNYKTGLGIRAGGYQNAISVKHFYKPTVAVEGLIGTGYFNRGINLTILLEKHVSAFGKKEFQLYYGGGAHIGSYRGDYFYRDYYRKKYRYYEDGFISLGIDGILGLEWTIPGIPISLGVDIKPTIELAQPGLSVIDGGLSIRYVF